MDFVSIGGLRSLTSKIKNFLEKTSKGMDFGYDCPRDGAPVVWKSCYNGLVGQYLVEWRICFVLWMACSGRTLFRKMIFKLKYQKSGRKSNQINRKSPIKCDHKRPEITKTNCNNLWVTVKGKCRSYHFPWTRPPMVWKSCEPQLVG